MVPPSILLNLIIFFTLTLPDSDDGVEIKIGYVGSKKKNKPPQLEPPPYFKEVYCDGTHL